MTLTYIEKFNFYIKSFVNEMIVIFPEYSDILKKNYSEILENENCKSDVYVKEYMDNIKPVQNYLAKKDEVLFKLNTEIFLLREIDFRNVWAKDINQVTRENIWKYLQTLVVIGKKLVGEEEDIDKLLDNFNKNQSDLLPNIDDIKQETENMMDMLKNMQEIVQDPEENTKEPSGNNPFEGGLINDIAKELTGELNLDNLNIGEPKNMNEAFSNLMGGGNGTNFFDLINKVGQKIQNKVQSGDINQNDLMKEAQNMMGSLKNPEQIAKQMRKNTDPHGGNSTRDRLRKKLEKK